MFPQKRSQLFDKKEILDANGWKILHNYLLSFWFPWIYRVDQPPDNGVHNLALAFDSLIVCGYDVRRFQSTHTTFWRVIWPTIGSGKYRRRACSASEFISCTLSSMFNIIMAHFLLRERLLHFILIYLQILWKLDNKPYFDMEIWIFLHTFTSFISANGTYLLVPVLPIYFV